MNGEPCEAVPVLDPHAVANRARSAIIMASRFIRTWSFMLTRGGRNTETGSVPRPLETGPLDRLRLQGRRHG